MLKFEREAIKSFGNIYTRTNKGNELVFICPKCNRPKLYVNTINGVFHCFRCDYAGKLKLKYSLANTKEKYNYENLKKQIVKKQKQELNLIYFEKRPLKEKQILALKNRGLSEQDIKYYNICGRSQDDRIQIPNYVKGSFTDVVCAWEYDKTKITDKNPKYLNSEGTLKSETLFNIYNINKNPDNIILCEGIFNAITAGKNAIASYGCSFSDIQCDILLSWEPKSILIAYDSDEPGVTGSMNVIKMLKNKNYKGKVEYILLPKNVDINDLGHDNFINYVNSNKISINLDNPISIKLPKMLYNN